ncbi:MAG: CpsB/CapC family capsule biosynthesis tyrosine phosphatase [Solirubrobacteraceae bacterium]
MLAAVDLHCHLLPGVDDGARDIGDTTAMAQQADADGIEAICATPHIRHDHDVRIHELPERLAEVTAALRAAGCRVRALPGGEVAATALDGLDDDELAAVSLGGGGRWILLEPASGPIDQRYEQAVGALQDRGYRALIAHPERHLGPDLVPRLARLLAGGALVQATAAFFLDPAIASGMLDLARAGVVHVLGSDAHSSHGGRPVALAAALQALGTVQPATAHLEWIARIAPQAIVAGRELVAPFAPARG